MLASYYILDGQMSTKEVLLIAYEASDVSTSYHIYISSSHGFFHISDVICPREGIFARDRRSRANMHFRGQITQLIWKKPCDNLYIACLVSIMQCFICFLLIWIGENTQSAHVSIVFWMFTLLGISTFSLWRCLNN